MSRLSVELIPMEFKLRAPLRTAGGDFSVRRSVIVRVFGGGRIGVGEGAPLESFGTESYDAMVAALRGAQEAWDRAKPPSRVTDAEALLARAGELDSAPAARQALECALLDLVAQQQRLPLASLLVNAPHGHSVRVAALLSEQRVDALVDDATAAVRAGHDTLKIKVGVGDLDADAGRIAAVRAAVGPQVRLRIDANGAWTVEDARAALRAFAPHRLELCEQPVRADDVAGLRSLRSAAGEVRIGADEALGNAQTRTLVLSTGAADVLVLKPMVLGGLRRTVELAQRASKQGITSYVTSSLEGPVGRLAALHVAVAIGDRSHAHGLGVGPLFEPSARPSLLDPRGGALSLLGEDGLGLTW